MWGKLTCRQLAVCSLLMAYVFFLYDNDVVIKLGGLQLMLMLSSERGVDF